MLINDVRDPPYFSRICQIIFLIKVVRIKVVTYDIHLSTDVAGVLVRGVGWCGTVAYFL